MPTYPYGDRRPTVDPSAFLAPGARVVGDVTIGARASVWFNAVIRGDSDAVRVGAQTSIQDVAALHTDPGVPCEVGDGCVVGHGAIVHACTVSSGCLIGMGAVLLTGAVIGEGSLVAAGAVVTEGREFGPRSVLAGVPARVVRELDDAEAERLVRGGVRHYLAYVDEYRRGGVGA